MGDQETVDLQSLLKDEHVLHIELTRGEARQIVLALSCAAHISPKGSAGQAGFRRLAHELQQIAESWEHTTERPSVAQARDHLGAALAQVVENDDAIIVDHLRKAHELLSQCGFTESEIDGIKRMCRFLDRF